jgi:hypothetical protein
MSKLKLGAPSLTGKDANDLVAKAFADAAFPLTLTFVNKVPFALSFPEVSGLFLKPSNHDGGYTVTAQIKDYDALQRLASSIEQIAELNKRELLVEVFDVDVTPDVNAEASSAAVEESAPQDAVVETADTDKPPGKKR